MEAPFNRLLIKAWRKVTEGYSRCGLVTTDKSREYRETDRNSRLPRGDGQGRFWRFETGVVKAIFVSRDVIRGTTKSKHSFNLAFLNSR